MRKWSNIVLGVWLLLTGAVALFDLSIPESKTLLAMLGLATGILIVMGDREVKLHKNLGRVLLAGWLILGALLTLISLHFNYSETLMAILAMAAGITILIGT